MNMSNIIDSIKSHSAPYQVIWAGMILAVIVQLFPIDPAVSGLISLVIGIATFVAILLDVKKLKSDGMDAPSRWWSLVSVVYMYRRDKAVNPGSYRKANAFLILFVILCILSGIQGVRQNTNDFADSSCQVTSTIPSLARQNISCIKVTDMKKIAPDWYQGEVLLSNMETYKILTHDLHDGNIQVSLH